MALALAMVLQATPTPAVAVTGFDSAFLFESDWLIVKAGESGQAAVTFLNTGSVSWQKGGASQVNLATCCPLNSPPTHAAWAVTWLSSTAYATHREDLVAPGGRGTYIWNFKAPDNAAPGIYDFPGDLVLASTGEAIHREGYFHRNDVRPVVAPNATKLELTPDFVNGIVGTNVNLTATATADPPAGSTTRPAAAGVEVTFFVDGDNAANPDFTRNATTDASGIATLTYTRSATGTDSIQAWVTANPVVRDPTASVVQWQIAQRVGLTPDDAATVRVGGSRTYTVTVKKADGTAASGQAIKASFTENQDTATSNDTTAQINGITPGTPTPVALTADANGIAAFTVTAAAATGPATPIAWIDDATANSLIDAGEFRDTGGSVTFAAPRATFTLTPDDTATAANNGQRVYTITAVDQFAAAYTGAARISFVEITDDSTTTTTSAVVVWFDNDDTLRTTSATEGGCSNVPTGTKDSNGVAGPGTVAGQGNINVASLSSAGKATFAICSTSATTGTPVVWQELGTADQVRQTNEPQDTGGATTFVAPAASKGGMSPSAVTNQTSASGNDDTSPGEETFTFTIQDQSGNTFDPTGDVTISFTVQNTGSATVFITDINGSSLATAPIQVTAGGSQTVTATTSTASATIEVDATSPTSANVTGTMAANASVTATGTKTWVTASDETAVTAGQSLAGTVLAVDKGASSSDGTGSYILQTTVGNFVITYASTDNFRIQGTDTTGANWEPKLSVGDSVTWTKSTPELHNITTDQP